MSNTTIIWRKHGPWLKKPLGKKKYNKISLNKFCIGHKEITGLKTTGENRFFTEIGPNLAKDTDPSSVTFDNYLKTFNINQLEHNLQGQKITVNELKDAFSLKHVWFFA